MTPSSNVFGRISRDYVAAHKGDNFGSILNADYGSDENSSDEVSSSEEGNESNVSKKWDTASTVRRLQKPTRHSSDNVSSPSAAKRNIRAYCRIKDISDIQPVKRLLADDYILHGDKSKLCMINALAASKHGFTELEEAWKLAGIILTPYRKDTLESKDQSLISPYDVDVQAGFLQNSWILEMLFSKYEAEYDIQMLAMLALTFDYLAIGYNDAHLPSLEKKSSNGSFLPKMYSGGVSNSGSELSPPLYSPFALSQTQIPRVEPYTSVDLHIDRLGAKHPRHDLKSSSSSQNIPFLSVTTPVRTDFSIPNISASFSPHSRTSRAQSSEILSSTSGSPHANIAFPVNPQSPSNQTRDERQVYIRPYSYSQGEREIYMIGIARAQRFPIYRKAYADYLYAAGLLMERLEVLGSLDIHDPSLDNGNNLSTTRHAYKEYLPPSIRPFLPFCDRCHQHTLNGECQTCRGLTDTPRCTVCEIPPLNLSTYCQTCLHGGHINCYLDWFVKNGSEQCPFGCGCSCFPSLHPKVDSKK